MNWFIEQPNLLKLDFPISISHNYTANNHLIVNPHIHNIVEVLYLYKGNADINIEENNYVMNEGDIVIINPNIIHSINANSQFVDFLVVQFDFLTLINPITKFNIDIINKFYYELDLLSIIKKNTISNDMLTNCLNRIDNANKDNIANNCFIISLLFEFIGICFEHIPKPTTPVNSNFSKDKVAIYKALSYLEENYKDNISIEHISKASGYSISQFSRIIKKYSNMTFVQYLNNLRINKACNEILNGAMISESAYNSGFNSLTSFNRVFKNIRNMTPSQWMRIYK